MNDLVIRLIESIKSAEHVTVAAIVAFVMTEILLLVIANFLVLKALLLRRGSRIGVALSDNNLAMALVYYTALIGLWIPFVKHPYIAIALRVVVFITAFRAVTAFVDFYGGWRATAAQCVDAIKEICTACSEKLSGKRARQRVILRTRRRHAPRIREAVMLAKLTK